MSWLFWRRPVIKLYQPDAEAVSLVIDQQDSKWPMKKDAHGVWSKTLHLPYRDLQGRRYHFEIGINGERFQLSDPLALRTDRKEKELHSYFIDPNYKFESSGFTTPDIRDIVIYETHLPALTRHESAPIDNERHRGTYAGASSAAILSYLQKLKVAVEFLPLHAHDQELGQDWGYFSTSFRAMRTDYALDKKRVNQEVMALVDAYHSHGIPVLLDVVFNHGGELWVKAWGKEVVYRKLPGGDYCNGSGCGPTIQTEHPYIRETIIETLLQLVENYRFDGFRFDLGALHDKQTMLEIDRRLPKRIYLIAEPWALGGTKWGKGDLHKGFANTRWAVWNDDFREPARAFIKGIGNHHDRDRFMRAIAGTHAKDGGWALRPQQCINYLTSHDGLTLADLLNGDKHRIFLGIMIVLTAQGIPMLSEGSEMLYSKQGHDNSYNRPDLNQLDWTQAKKHHDLVQAVARMITLRKQLDHFRYTGHLRVNNHKSDHWDIDWIYPTGYPHADNVSAIGYLLRPPPKDALWKRKRHPIIVLMNGSHTGVNFHLPKGAWKVLVDGLHLKVNPFGISSIPEAHDHYHCHAGTGAILSLAN